MYEAEHIGHIFLLEVKKVLPQRSSQPALTSILRRKPGPCQETVLGDNYG